MRLFKGIRILYSDLRSLLKREVDFYKINPNTSTLFLTYRCNSKCKTCTMWLRPHDEEIRKEIDLDGWRTIIDKISDAGIRTAEIFGGNVLLRKEVLIPVLKCLYDKGMAVHLPTNQIGLDDDVADAIVKYVNTVYISIDGLGDQQDEIRGIAGASNLSEDSIAKLLRHRKENHENNNKLIIVCNYTVSKFNLENMHGIVQYAINKCFDEIHFEYAGEFDRIDVENSKINGIIPEPYYIKQDSSILTDKEGAERIKRNITDIKKTYQNSNITISTLNIDSISVKNMYQGTIPHNKCYVERGEVTIDPYGNMVVCPFINNYSMGNVLISAFKEIWNNERHKYFRKIQNSGALPMCKHCILGVQRNPGVIKSLQRIYLTRIKPVLSRRHGLK